MTWQFVTGPTRLSMVGNLCIFQRVSVFYKQILPFYTQKTQCDLTKSFPMGHHRRGVRRTEPQISGRCQDSSQPLFLPSRCSPIGRAWSAGDR